MKETVKVICYGEEETWASREKAKQFYLECMTMSEGSERDRYTNIYLDLVEGKTVCVDEE